MALAVPCTTAIFNVAPFNQFQSGIRCLIRSGTTPTSFIGSSAYLIPSNPLTGVMSAFAKTDSIRWPVTNSTTVLRAASITPPVAPNINPAPEASPKGSSKCDRGISGKYMPASLIICASSRVVKP